MSSVGLSQLKHSHPGVQCGPEPAEAQSPGGPVWPEPAEAQSPGGTVWAGLTECAAFLSIQATCLNSEVHCDLTPQEKVNVV